MEAFLNSQTIISLLELTLLGVFSYFVYRELQRHRREINSLKQENVRIQNLLQVQLNHINDTPSDYETEDDAVPSPDKPSQKDPHLLFMKEFDIPFPDIPNLMNFSGGMEASSRDDKIEEIEEEESVSDEDADENAEEAEAETEAEEEESENSPSASSEEESEIPPEKEIDLDVVDEDQTCQVPISRGTRKGQPCGAPVKQGSNSCKNHS